MQDIAKGESAMLYNYIKEHYKEAEPIFLSDLLRANITELDLKQQLKELCEKELLQIWWREFPAARWTRNKTVAFLTRWNTFCDWQT